MRDRSRGEQRALERFRRGDVGLCGALAHGDANPRAREIDAAAGRGLALPDEIIDHFSREDGEVAIGSGRNVFLEAHGRAPDRVDLGCALALASRQDFEHDRFDAVAAENLHPGAFPFSAG